MATAGSETARPGQPAGSVPPEFELLVECALPPSVRDRTERRQAVPHGELSWSRVVDLGVSHGVVPLLSRHVETSNDSSVPADILGELRQRSQAVTMRNLTYANELHSILDQFEDAGVRALPFKGPVLAESAYGDLSLRTFGDLDVLVHSDDVPTAVDILERDGYEWEEDLPRRDDSPVLGGPVTMPLVPEYQCQREDLRVELRWRVGEPGVPFGVDFETLYERRERVAVAGEELPALDPTDRLLMLAYHGTKHQWRLLKWGADFAAAVATTAVDWDVLFDRARTSGLGRPLHLALALATSLFGVETPERVSRAVRADDRAMRLAASVVASFEAGEPPRPSGVDRLAFNARAADSPREALQLLAGHHRLHPSLFEYGLCALPGELHALYYPLVPVRLAAVGASKLLRSVGVS
jgi:hypothetical protein